jgi:N-formylglutamate amidohydrolase
MIWDFREGELFEIWEPDHQQLPFILNSPHSGRIYPKEFVENSRLDQIGIRRSEDHFVDELFFLRRPPRRADAGGEFPTRLCRCESRAL